MSAYNQVVIETAISTSQQPRDLSFLKFSSLIYACASLDLQSQTAIGTRTKPAAIDQVLTFPPFDPRDGRLVAGGLSNLQKTHAMFEA